MNDDHLRHRIKQAAHAHVPDVKSRVLAQARRPQPRQSHGFRYAFAGTLALLLLAVFAFWPSTTDVYATVHLDINPSIAVDLDEDEQVLEVRALNTDAQLLISAIDLSSFDNFDDLINAIVDEAIQRGVMSESNPFIMIDITGHDVIFVQNLYDHLSTRIPQHAMDRIPNAEIIRGHAGEAVGEEVARAREHNMSVQRLRLIEALLDTTEYDFDTLKTMSVAELVHLAREHDVDTNHPGPPDRTPGPPNSPGPP